ncbi:MAG: hypothetical protein AAFV53_06960 [Myxococcota bacterium]
MPVQWQEESRIVMPGTSMHDSRVVVITQSAPVSGGTLYQTITIKENPPTQSETMSTAMVFVPDPQ